MKQTVFVNVKEKCDVNDITDSHFLSPERCEGLGLESHLDYLLWEEEKTDGCFYNKHFYKIYSFWLCINAFLMSNFELPTFLKWMVGILSSLVCLE